jgi:hypothetical protein
VLTVPSEPDPVDVDTYDLSELAADAERATKDLPPTIVEVAPIAAVKPVKNVRSAKSVKSSSRAPTAIGPKIATDDVFLDPRRDVVAPAVLAVLGAVLLVAYYATRYPVGLGGVMGVAAGLSIMDIIEAVLLIGVAVLIAGPAGVSFGDPRTAWYKFTAIALFCDGVSTWVNGTVARFAGGFGNSMFGYWTVGFPVALGIYWVLLTYLFSMDPSDGWSVVSIISISYRVIRVALVSLLLPTALAWGGVPASDISVPRFGNAAPVDPVFEQIEEAKNLGLLNEARGYIAKMGRTAESGAVESWYAAGAKNVWYETSRDINGHGNAFRVVIELPSDKAARANIFDLVKKNWLDAFHVGYDPDEMKDMGEPYLMVALPPSGAF